MSINLSDRFIRSDRIARILDLAVESGQNVLLWGPAGHGKSEMVEAALSQVSTEIFVQSFGEGMDEATLWGGLDLAALENEKVIRYFPENSFLACQYAIFEEIFDAPASVLLALKDTLTARRLRKGTQQYPMKTRIIVGITNRDPAEIAELGPAAHALIERFPLQLKVEWKSYSAGDYLALLNKVVPIGLNGFGPILAEILAKAGENERPISPRAAVRAAQIVKAAAALRGSNSVEKQDLLDLRFLPGLEFMANDIQKELDAAMERAAAEDRMVAAEKMLRDLNNEARDATSPIRHLQVAKRAVAFQDEISSMRVTDSLTARRNAVRDGVAKLIASEQAAAMATTKI